MKKQLLILLLMTVFLTAAQAQKKTVPSANGRNAQGSVSSVGEEIISLPNPEIGFDGSLGEALRNRQTVRDLREGALPNELLSSLLWSAYGFNRLGEKKRVVPSAMNVQEFDIYLFLPEGVYRYDAEKNALFRCLTGDHRAEISAQKHFAVAPASVLIVANYDRMTKFKNVEDRDFYAAVDCGYVSQNIYLFCASSGLGTVACGAIERDALKKLLGIKNGKPMLAHPVGGR